MSLSKMVARCKKSKHVFIYQLGDLKYLSDGHILYRLKDYSSVCLENIFEYMDVPDNRKEDYYAAVRPIEFETYIDESTYCENLERFPKKICMPDPMIAFRSGKGMILVDDKLFDVFRPLPGHTKYYISAEKESMVLVVCDREVIGGIMPIKCDFEKLHDELSAMTHEAREAYLNHLNSASHQVTMGEIMKEAVSDG